MPSIRYVRVVRIESAENAKSQVFREHDGAHAMRITKWSMELQQLASRPYGYELDQFLWEGAKTTRTATRSEKEKRE